MSITDILSVYRARVRRPALFATLSLVLATTTTFAGVGEADAAIVRYFPCPQTVPGMGCGISGSVGPGNYTAEYKFATASGYDFEPFVDYCETECPVYHWAIGRKDRTPAGYQIVSDAPFTLSGTFSK